MAALLRTARFEHLLQQGLEVRIHHDVNKFLKTRLRRPTQFVACLGRISEESVDFRSLCMRKRASHASPLVLKAVLRACGTAFADFAESVSSPTKLVLIILFCLTGTAAPMIKAVSMLCLQQLKKRRTRRDRRRAPRRIQRAIRAHLCGGLGGGARIDE